MLDFILKYDKKAFLYLNSKHAPELDGIMWWISGNKSWIPLYIVMLFIIIYHEWPRRFIYTILFMAITVMLCDQLSALIKFLVERPRPTHDYEIANMVHIVNSYKGGAYGFVSSHAANCFGVAAFLSNWFKHYKWSILMFTWAIIVSYSRIYLGVHYPLDILCGAFIGTIIGIQCYIFKVHTTVFVEKIIKIRK